MAFRPSDHEDPVQDVILVSVFVLVFGTFVTLAFVLIPPLRCLLYAGVLAVKGLEAFMAFDAGVGTAFFKAAWYYLTHPSAAINVPITHFFQAVWNSQASPLRVGVVGAVVGIVVWLALRIKIRQVPSEKTLLKRIKTTPPEQTLAEEFGVRDPLDLTDPKRAAKSFARIREKTNIPPAVVARAVKDRRIRLALLYYKDFLEKGRVLWPVSDPERLKKIRENELKRREEREKQKSPAGV
ncbi:hypothetical protein FVE67_08590 [Thermosulfurimonas marina]|uniref:Uncharacterized protein n=1 Tax=Thermosulfurimonas marina TaxID=2047767 RepID=A0A6H1WUH8_9BACT|nr:hypothetical protein [Thermosulfurimonas marina]QJA06840.1 hypothetical protein FVE67_08590 [Thermosulfurimonas marina]